MFVNAFAVGITLVSAAAPVPVGLLLLAELVCPIARSDQTPILEFGRFQQQLAVQRSCAPRVVTYRSDENYSHSSYIDRAVDIIIAQKAVPSGKPKGYSMPGGGPAYSPGAPTLGGDLVSPSLGTSSLPDIDPIPLPEEELPTAVVPAPPRAAQSSDEAPSAPNCESQETRDAQGCLVKRKYVCDGVVTKEELFSDCTR